MTAEPFEPFAFQRTSATYRVRVALTPTGLAARERFVDVDAGEQRAEAFAKADPFKQTGAPKS